MTYLGYKEVSNLLKCSKGRAYEIIFELRKRLRKSKKKRYLHSRPKLRYLRDEMALKNSHFHYITERK